jgi:hypothetical protein
MGKPRLCHRFDRPAGEFITQPSKTIKLVFVINW